MKITSCLEEDSIFEDLPGNTKEGIIASLVDALVAKGRLPSREPFFSAILKRESLGSTAVGDGVALPHARVMGLEEPVMALVRFKKGVGFGALDNSPVYLIFFILMPEEATELQLRILTKAAQLLRNPEVRSRMLEAKGPAGMFSILKEVDERKE